MQFEVGNESVVMRLDIPSGNWRICSRRDPVVELGEARVGVAGSAQTKPFTWEGDLGGVLPDGPRRVASPAGEATGLALAVEPDGLPLRLKLEFAVPDRSPFVLWRLQATNRSEHDVRLDRFDLLRAGNTALRTGGSGVGGLRLSGEGPSSFYLNGWQSWSYSGTLRAGQRQPRSSLGPLLRTRHEIPGARLSRRRGEFISDLYAVLLHPERKLGLLAGFLAQRQMFGRVHACLRPDAASLALTCPADGILLGPSATLTSDWACLQLVDLEEDQPLDPYLHAVAEMNGARSRGASPTGWCSWYQFFAGVDSDLVMENVNWMAKNRHTYPLQVVQLDDGYAARVGDWEHPHPDFGVPLDALSKQMAESGGTPGLWIAPFVTAHDSQVARNHPDWILRRRGGSPVGIGYTWGLRTRALDVSHPEVREFVHHTIHTAIHSWGFRYLKLDFLYAGALTGERYDRSQTRAQAYSTAMDDIRRAAGEQTCLLGCGGPLGPAVGTVDSMRIGPDVAVGWAPSYPGIPALPRGDPEFPAVRNALRNALSRAHLHGRWWVNDADCILLRPRGKTVGGGTTGAASRLTDAEVQSMLTVSSMLGGSMFVSDHLPSLPEERLAWLGKLLPLLPRGARLPDWALTDHPTTIVLPLSGAVGTWTLVARVNWGDEEIITGMELRELGLNPEPDGVHVVDFWRARYCGVQSEGLHLGRIPPHGAAWVAVRPVVRGPAWLGDTLHASQGGIVERWSADATSFQAVLAPGHPMEGNVWLALPGGAPEITLDRAPISARPVAHGVYCLDVAVEGRSVLEGRSGSGEGAP